MDYLPPCWQRDEWTRDTNHGPSAKTMDEKDNDHFETSRAQIICYTRCAIRAQCLDRALAHDEDEDFFVWGGWTDRERDQYRRTGPLQPPPLPNRVRDERRLTDLAIYDFSLEETAAAWGSTEKYVLSRMKTFIWLLRRDAQDPGVLLQGEESSVRVGIPQKPETVQAA